MTKSIIVALTILASAGASHAEQIFTCKNKNTALQFSVSEGAYGPTGGNMYINGVEVASLRTYSINPYSTRVYVEGAAAPGAFILDRQKLAVFLTDGAVVREVCRATVSG